MPALIGAKSRDRAAAVGGGAGGASRTRVVASAARVAVKNERLVSISRDVPRSVADAPSANEIEAAAAAKAEAAAAEAAAAADADADATFLTSSSALSDFRAANAEAALARARYGLRSHDPADALRAAEASLAIEPRCTAGLVLKGKAHQRLRQLGPAAASHLEALQNAAAGDASVEEAIDSLVGQVAAADEMMMVMTMPSFMCRR